jgi:hypothetical protein
LPVQSCVVAEIYEQLRGARIWSGGGEGDRAGAIRFFDWIVFEIGAAPGVIYLGMSAEAELNDEIGDDAKESGAIEEIMFGEIVETVCAKRCPCARDFYGEVAGGGFEFHLESFGRLACETGRLKQCLIEAHVCFPFAGGSPEKICGRDAAKKCRSRARDRLSNRITIVALALERPLAFWPEQDDALEPVRR